MLTVVCYVQFRKKASLKWRLAALLCFLCALGSKESALFFAPAFVGTWEFFTLSLQKKKSTKVIALDAIVIIVFYIVVRVSVIPKMWGGDAHHLSLGNHIGTSIVGLNHGFAMLFNPFLPTLSDATYIHGIAHIQTLIFVLLCAAVFLLYKKAKDARIKPFIILSLITLVPAANIIHLPRFVSPHYVFFTMIPCAAIIVLIVQGLPRQYLRLGTRALIIWLVIAGWQTTMGGNRFKNDYTLFLPDVKTDKHFLEGHFYLGYYYFSVRDLQNSEKEFAKANLIQKDIVAFVDRIAAKNNAEYLRNKLK